MPSVLPNRGSGRNASRHALTYGNEELHTPAPSNKRTYAAQRKVAKLNSKLQCRNDRKRPSFSESGTESNTGDNEEHGADGASEDDDDFGDADDSSTDATEPRAKAPSDVLRKRKMSKTKRSNANRGWLQMSTPSNFSHQAGLEHMSVELQTQELTVLEFGPLDHEIEQWKMTTLRRSRRKKRESVDFSSSDDEAYKLLEMMSDDNETDGEIERVEDRMVIEDVLASGDLDMGDLDDLDDLNMVPMSPFSQNQNLQSGIQTADESQSYLDFIIPPQMIADALQDLQDGVNDSPVDMQDFGFSPALAFGFDMTYPGINMAPLGHALAEGIDTGLPSPSPSIHTQVNPADPYVTDAEDDGNKDGLTVAASSLSRAQSLSPVRASVSARVEKKPKAGRFKLKRSSQHIMMHGRQGKLLTGPKNSTVKANAPESVPNIVPSPTPHDLGWTQSSPGTLSPNGSALATWEALMPNNATTKLTLSQSLHFMDNIIANLPVSHVDQIVAQADRVPSQVDRNVNQPTDVDMDRYIQYPSNAQ